MTMIRLCSWRRAAAAAALAGLALLAACGSDRGDPRYAAEKRLFRARKLREDVIAGGMKPEFVQRAVDAYRAVVTAYGDSAAAGGGLETIVVSAQMELAELEFRALLLREARTDFARAAGLARRTPPARANALYSAGVISEELAELDRAIAYYERFCAEFLPLDSLAATARMHTRYLVAPLKIAELERRAGRDGEADRWCREAERIYRRVIESESDPGLLRETRFNLLAALAQRRAWNDALALARDLAALYPEPPDRSAIAFVEAKILEGGARDAAGARDAYVAVAKAYPKEREAALALLAAAAIDHGRGRTADERSLLERVVKEYGDRMGEVVEAHWRLATLDESDGKWEDASLRYKSIYTNYPETLQGFEAPLRVAASYAAKGERDAAAAAYERAIEQYRRLAGERYRQTTRIMAEEYLVRALVETKRWREAVDALLALPDRYPAYAPFGENYLRAASIQERELGDPASAARTLEACAAKYPGTDLARAAEKELARLAR